MQFDCEHCGKVDHALLDGYDFGDRLLEGVMFEVRVADDGTISIQVQEKHRSYFSQLNEQMWLEAAKERAEEILSDPGDGFYCPKCHNFFPHNQNQSAQKKEEGIIGKPIKLGQIGDVLKKLKENE